MKPKVLSFIDLYQKADSIWNVSDNDLINQTCSFLEKEEHVYIHTITSNTDGNVSKRITNYDTFPAREFGLKDDANSDFFNWSVVKIK